MARTGQVQKQRKAALAARELDGLAEEFANAMRSAHTPYIAAEGRMTPKMSEIWGRYQMFCIDQTNEEK